MLISNQDDMSLEGLTLLLCDDEVRLRQIITLMVQEMGAKVIEVDSAEKAVEFYISNYSSIDVVMLDLRMNGMDGKAAYRLIKDFDPVAKILIASGVRPDEDFIAELERESCAFVEKPFDMETLGTTIRAISQG